MVSLSDVYNQLTAANANLQILHNDMVAQTKAIKDVKQAVQDVDHTLNDGFLNISKGIHSMLELMEYTNKALVHLSDQNETIICNLGYISKQTCQLVSEARVQTDMQRTMESNIVLLTELYKTTHPEATLELERLTAVKNQISKCCPKKETEPACKYQPCEAAGRLESPPTPEYPAYKPTTKDENK